MGLELKKIKNLFIVEDDASEKDKVQQVSPKDPEKKSRKDAERKDSQITTTVTVNEKILDSLLSAIEKNNLPGEDYFEFMEAVEAMKGLQLDEDVKYKTVLVTLATKGLTKERVVDSVDHYLEVLETEKKKFYDVLNEETENKVKGQKQSIIDLESLNRKKADEIAKLTDEINNNNKRINQIKEQMTISEQKIRKTERDFIATFDFVKNRIKLNLQRIRNINL